MRTIGELIHQILKKPPPELVTVVRALHQGNATHLALSFVCLRCFVPPLAQATMDMTVSEEVQTLLRLGAKGLQLVANDIEPPSTSPLYLHRAQLKVCIFFSLCGCVVLFCLTVFFVAGIYAHPPSGYHSRRRPNPSFIASSPNLIAQARLTSLQFPLSCL